MTEAPALHMFVSDFHHQLRTQRFPRQIFALAPAALSARHPLTGFGVLCHILGPALPWVIGKRILAIRRKVIDELTTHAVREAPANADMLQRTRLIVKTKQQ